MNKRGRLGNLASSFLHYTYLQIMYSIVIISLYYNEYEKRGKK